ncbi:MAG TPA: uracil-DNA glycosylase [Pyrinomonadaceae bacterium]
MDSNELQDLIAKTKKQLLHLQMLGVEGIQLERSDVTLRANAPAQIRVEKESLKAPVVSAPPVMSAPPVKPNSPNPDRLFGGFGKASEALEPSTETFEDIHRDIGDCTRCALHLGRTNICHTEGNRKARLMFVGEAPGADEDAQARPFVGRAGQLLTKIIEAIGFKREEVLIGNINRCRPPGNRAPMPDEAAICKPFLLREIAIVRPAVIVVLGNTAMKNLLDTREGITRLRGIFQEYKGIKVMPTFHPAYLLRDPSKKRETWEDLKKVRDYLDNTAK